MLSIEPIDTGRREPPVATPPFLPGNAPGIQIPGQQPGAPSTRMSFLQAFLANLGPGLAGGLMSAPGAPFGTGLAGSLAGIEEQKRYTIQQQILQQQMALQQQTQARENA